MQHDMHTGRTARSMPQTDEGPFRDDPQPHDHDAPLTVQVSGAALDQMHRPRRITLALRELLLPCTHRQ